MHSNRWRSSNPGGQRRRAAVCRYPPFEKDFYEEDAAIAAMNELSVVRAARIGVPVSTREYPWALVIAAMNQLSAVRAARCGLVRCRV